MPDVFFPVLLGEILQYIVGPLMFLTSLFLILLVLVQRGRGGGLAGAFGGMGGQSAFGTKAGDLFTRITMVVAAFWILLCIFAIATLGKRTSVFGSGTPNPQSVFDSPVEGGDSATLGEPATTGGGLEAGASETTGAASPSTGGTDGDQE